MARVPADGWSCFSFRAHAPSGEPASAAAQQPGWIETAVADQRNIWRLPRDMIAPELVALVRFGPRKAPFARPGIGRLRRRGLRYGLRAVHLALLLPLGLEAAAAATRRLGQGR